MGTVFSIIYTEDERLPWFSAESFRTKVEKHVREVYPGRDVEFEVLPKSKGTQESFNALKFRHTNKQGVALIDTDFRFVTFDGWALCIEKFMQGFSVDLPFFKAVQQNSKAKAFLDDQFDCLEKGVDFSLLKDESLEMLRKRGNAEGKLYVYEFFFTWEYPYYRKVRSAEIIAKGYTEVRRIYWMENPRTREILTNELKKELAEFALADARESTDTTNFKTLIIFRSLGADAQEVEIDLSNRGSLICREAWGEAVFGSEDYVLKNL